MAGEKQVVEWDDKDKDETLAYTHNWASRLKEGSVITAVDAVIDRVDQGEIELEIVGVPSFTQTIQKTRVSGGKVGQKYHLTLIAEVDGGPDAGGELMNTGVFLKIRDW